MYLFKYEKLIRKKIIDYKFYDKSYLYETFAELFLNNKKVCEFIKSYDIIIPIPIHNKRKKERGYNQSELIAKKIAINMRKKINTKILIKINNTKPQSKLNKEERKENIKDSYSINSKYIKEIENKKILLFDDIYTTGCTANECAKILQKYSTKEISILTIAKD